MNLFKTYLSVFCLAIAIAAGCKKDNPPPPPTVPVVTTAVLTNITTSGATAGGSIVSDGRDTITASGIVWSETNAMPTLADSVVAGNTSTGTFSVDISGLEFDKSYYIRAFATNSVGTGYGEVVTLNTANDTNKVRFTYNGEEVVYGIIESSTTGRKWLDRNLGAKQVATASNDYLAYGDMFQWGRPADGHQLINWSSATEGLPVNGTTSTLAASDNPGHSSFIITEWTPETPNDDWRDDNNRNRWASNPQGPCPNGWHVPTIEEWAAEVSVTSDDAPNNDGTATVGGMKGNSTAYSILKLPTAGEHKSDGLLNRAGERGRYWSSSDYMEGSTSNGIVLGVSEKYAKASSGSTAAGKATAVSVRCIKD